MATTPWLTSNKLIEAVKRKISFPTDQSTFSPQEILDFANEEMMIQQVPSVLEYHEEYFVYSYKYLIQTNQTRFPIPDRAIGLKLRDVKWQDTNGNFFDMTRVAAEDKGFYQRNLGTNETINKYYLENNDVVLLPSAVAADGVSIYLWFFIRPNQLVANERAAIIQSFQNYITTLNAYLNPLDTVTIDDEVFTATNGTSVLSNSTGNPTIITTAAPHNLISGTEITLINNTSTPNINGDYTVTVLSPTTFSIPANVGTAGNDGLFFQTDSEFLIGSNDIETATNLTTTINNNGIASANNGSPSTSTVTLDFTTLSASQNVVTSNEQAILIPEGFQAIKFDQVPTTFTDPLTGEVTPLFQSNSIVDFLQTKPGHKIRAYDIQIPTNGISSNVITFTLEDVPDGLLLGDYVCLQNECIIPMIPPDLHSGLAERTAARILAAIGDMQGLQASLAKISDIDKQQTTLLDNRVESSPLKISSRHTILRYQTAIIRRRRGM